MKAALCTKYGDPSVIRVVEWPVPEIKRDELLIRVHATTVDSADVRMRSLHAPFPLNIIMRLMMGISKPRQPVFGHCFSGTVEKTGAECREFKVGDRLFGSTEGMQFGAHAEYLKIKEKAPLTFLPEGATDAEAVALLFGGSAALYFLEKAGYRKGQKILILGGSGAVGSSALQLCARKGLIVHAVSSRAHEVIARELGARKVFERKSDWTQESDHDYDIIFDAVGRYDKKEVVKRMKSDGRYITVASSDVAKETRAQVEELKKAFEEGTLRALVDREFSLDQIIEAHAYVDRGSKVGAAVIRMEA